MRGHTLVITGATSGIGLAAAEGLARAGARVVFTARDEAKAHAARDRLLRANPDAAHDWVLADLTTIGAMKQAAADIAAKAPRIDVLANNAGAIFDRRQVTADGLEKTFAVNHMAYFVVTELLRPNLSPGARIISTASGVHAMAPFDLDNLQLKRGWSAMGAYALSKLCNILWTRELARRLAGGGITANCLHPGGVATGFGANNRGLMPALFGLARRFMLTPEQGAETLVWLALSKEVEGVSGAYFTRRAVVEPSRAARDDEAARRLWEISAELAGLPA
jgi:NAD(P)-dependent dehydrogenase (short-subunit alcohol dehydrogenase family)